MHWTWKKQPTTADKSGKTCRKSGQPCTFPRHRQQAIAHRDLVKDAKLAKHFITNQNQKHGNGQLQYERRLQIGNSNNPHPNNYPPIPQPRPPTPIPNPDPNPDLPLSTHPNHQRHFIFVLCNFSRLSLLLCLRHVITAVEWAACISINGIDVCDRSSVLWANSWGKRSEIRIHGDHRASELIWRQQNLRAPSTPTELQLLSPTAT
jgi:hypothetical protein